MVVPGPESLAMQNFVLKTAFLSVCYWYFSVPVDVNDMAEMTKIVQSCIGTKFINKWSELACKIAIEATSTVALEENGRKEIDIKRYAKVEKIPGGTMEDSKVLRGTVLLSLGSQHS